MRTKTTTTDPMVEVWRKLWRKVVTSCHHHLSNACIKWIVHKNFAIRQFICGSGPDRIGVWMHTKYIIESKFSTKSEKLIDFMPYSWNKDIHVVITTPLFIFFRTEKYSSRLHLHLVQKILRSKKVLVEFFCDVRNYVFDFLVKRFEFSACTAYIFLIF